jgi:hypothetical protein
MRKVQVGFDIDAAQFTVSELAQISGIKRAAIDMYLHRGVLLPARRESISRPKRGTKGRSPKVHGRPLFSVVSVFMARLIRELGDALGLGPSEASLAANAAANAEISARELKATKIVGMTSDGNWMRLLARSIEEKQPLDIYGYAIRSSGQWLFDIHVGVEGTSPTFGSAAAYIRVPLSKLFIPIYGECIRIAK